MGSVVLLFLLTHPLEPVRVPSITIESGDGSVVLKELTLFRASRTGTGGLVPAFSGTIENNTTRAFGPLVQFQIGCVVAVKVGREQKSATICLDFDLSFPAVAPSSARRFDEVLSMWMDKLPPCEVASARAVPLSRAPNPPEDRARQAAQAAKVRAELTKPEALLAEPKRYEEEQAAAAEAKRKAQEAAKRRAAEEARRKFLAQHPVLYSGAEPVFICADRHRSFPPCRAVQ